MQRKEAQLHVLTSGRPPKCGRLRLHHTLNCEEDICSMTNVVKILCCRSQTGPLPRPFAQPVIAYCHPASIDSTQTFLARKVYTGTVHPWDASRRGGPTPRPEQPLKCTKALAETNAVDALPEMHFRSEKPLPYSQTNVSRPTTSSHAAHPALQPSKPVLRRAMAKCDRQHASESARYGPETWRARLASSCACESSASFLRAGAENVSAVHLVE